MLTWIPVFLTLVLVLLTAFYAVRTSDMVKEMTSARKEGFHQYLDTIWSNILQLAKDRNLSRPLRQVFRVSSVCRCGWWGC